MISLGKVCRIKSRGGTGYIITATDYELQFKMTFKDISTISWMIGKELMIDSLTLAAHITCSGITIATILRCNYFGVFQVTFYPTAAAHARQKLEDADE